VIIFSVSNNRAGGCFFSDGRRRVNILFGAGAISNGGHQTNVHVQFERAVVGRLRFVAVSGDVLNRNDRLSRRTVRGRFAKRVGRLVLEGKTGGY